MFLLILLLLCLLPLFLLGFLLHVLLLHNRYAHLPGPARSSFLLGHAGYLLERYQQDRTGFTLGLELRRQYGPVLVLWYAVKPQVLVTDVESIKETILSNVHGKLERRPEVRLFGERFVGRKSIFVNCGDERWKKTRRSYNRHFSRVNLRRYHDDVKVVARRLCYQLSCLADSGEEVDMNMWMNLAACDIIGRVAFAWDIDSVSRGDVTFARYLSEAFTGVALATGVPLSRVLPRYRDMRHTAVEAVKRLREECGDYIQVYKEKIEETRDETRQKEGTTGRDKTNERQDGNDKREKGCLLDEILELHPHDTELQVDEMLAMFVAGQETVAHVITFALSHVMREPHLVNLAEIQECMSSSDPGMEQLAHLTSLDNLMKETLRLYAPVPGLRRILSHDTVVAGHVIPAGAEIVHTMVLYAHLEDTWGSDTARFRPDRFEGSDGKNGRHPHAFLPFGIGPRVCIGKELAKIEFKTILSYLLFSFKFVPREGDDIKAMRAASLKPMSGYLCFVETLEDFSDK